MPLIQKISPVGIDRNVDEIQVILNELNWAGFNIYPRIYKEKIGDNVKPMAYVGNGEYVDVFNNDNLTTGNCFFYDSGTQTATDLMYKNTQLSIVFQVNLNVLFPSVLHRADEEAHKAVLIKLRELSLPYEVTGIVKELENVYSEFDTTQVQFDDIGKFHVFRVDMTCLVSYLC